MTYSVIPFHPPHSPSEIIHKQTSQGTKVWGQCVAVCPRPQGKQKTWLQPRPSLLGEQVPGPRELTLECHTINKQNEQIMSNSAKYYE